MMILQIVAVWCALIPVAVTPFVTPKYGDRCYHHRRRHRLSSSSASFLTFLSMSTPLVASSDGNSNNTNNNNSKNTNNNNNDNDNNNNQELNRERKKKKTVADRTQAETQSLIEDVLKTAFDAGGPRAAPIRTLQAYLAVSQTVQEFLPRPTSGFGRRRRGQAGPPQEFSPPKALRILFEKLGATYIKLGQFIASSPTIFPKDYVVEFQKCLDQTEPLEWSVIKQVIETELNGPISSTFSYVDTQPLASASIAQVHTATLKSTGDEVVIKVQKPGIDQSLKADLGFVYIASRILEFLQPDWERTSLSGIVGDIRSSMLEELDFQKEARNTIEFRRYLQENNLLHEATAPRVYLEYTTKKIFTMEKLNGVSMLDEETISKATQDPMMGQKAITTALNIWTMSVSQMPWFHADVHAGNLLLLNDGRVGFIDFGIVGRVSDNTFSAVNELSTALTVGDYEGMARALCNMGATEETVDVVKFGQDIATVMQRISTVQPDITINQNSMDGSVSGSVAIDETDITNILLEIVNVTEDNGLKLPREFGLLVKQSLYFDRYLKILAPDMEGGAFGGFDSMVEEGGVQKINGSTESNKELVIDV